MYAGFNGEYRRKPIVSIRGTGASKKETKEDLVRRLKEERAEREVSQCLHFILCQINYISQSHTASPFGDYEQRADTELFQELPRTA